MHARSIGVEDAGNLDARAGLEQTSEELCAAGVPRFEISLKHSSQNLEPVKTRSMLTKSSSMSTIA